MVTAIDDEYDEVFNNKIFYGKFILSSVRNK